jgi:ribose 5-phosphate isomerase B
VTIAVAADHAGCPLKDLLVDHLESIGHRAVDLGTHGAASVDYPDYAGKLCRAILEGRADRGILVCNSGIGMSMAANRYRGIRAALCLFPVMAAYARRHNDANVLVLGGGFTAPFLAFEIVRTFLAEESEGGRHVRRTGKLDMMEGLE